MGESRPAAPGGEPPVSEQPSAAAALIAPSIAAGARLPDFFIVGHPKCGTTAMHHMLRAHPAVHMPLKEPRFFAQELRSRFRRLGPGTLPVTLPEYLALFAAAEPNQRIGEASPQYLRSEHAASRIAQAAPHAKIIAILREPASFLRSFHLQAVHNLVETETDLRRALELEPARRAGRHVPWLSQAPQALLYSDHVRYVEQLERFHAAFPAEQVLVLIYDDLRRDNAATMHRVLSFLEIEDTAPIEPVRTPTLPAVRSPSLYRLGIATAPVRRRVISEAAWRRLVFKPADPPDERLAAELRERFRGEVAALSEYLGRDLIGEWGYDHAG